jgi:hypothetical protein
MMTRYRLYRICGYRRSSAALFALNLVDRLRHVAGFTIFLGAILAGIFAVDYLYLAL